METAAVELLNTLRTATFAPDGRKRILGTIDAVETLFDSFQRQIEAYHSVMADREQQIAEMLERLSVRDQEFALLEQEFRLQIAKRFGKSREKWNPDEKLQAQLFNEIEAAIREAAAEAKAGDPPANAETVKKDSAESQRRQKEGTGHGGRKPLPSHLLRVERILDLPAGDRVCSSCGKTMSRIGQETSERLCMKPIEFYVEATVRPTYTCGCGCGGIQTAPVPNQIIPKSIASPSVLSQILASKFCDALPFYRQSNILKKREGIDISRATMARWSIQAHLAILPMSNLIRKEIRTSKVMHLDETRVRVLHEDGEIKEGLSWMWCAAARIANPVPEPNRPEIKLITYNYAAGRDMGVAARLIEGFKGTLMTDAYSAYDSPARLANIRQAACMAHVRRYFHDILKVQKSNPKAQKALAFISALYGVERELASRAPEELLKARQERSKPIMAAFWAWLSEEARTVLPKSMLGKAILYTIPLWERLCVYLEDPKVPIDNNIAEQAIRPFAVGRRNWLFFDQNEGAEASTSFYTVIETARANDMEPMHYLRFLFNCIERFGLDSMPWEKLLPVPALRSYAESIGIPYAMGL